MCRETFLLKKSFFSIYSNAGQDFDDEIANEEQRTEDLNEKKVYVKTKQYIEEVARDKLGLVNPDEIILKEK